MIIDKLHKWIAEGESEKIEFKTSFGQDTIETLVAFANAKGGNVLIGVSNNAEIVGVTVSKESINQWINEIKSKTAPLVIPDADVLDVDGKVVVCLTIAEYPIKPVSFKGRYFRRKANSNHQLSPGEVANLHLQSINSSWDAYPREGKIIDDISFDKIQAVIERMRKNNLSITEDPLSFLYKYNMIKDDRLTNAAYLLFKKEDSYDTTIELGRFQDEITIKDTARSKSDIITQIEEVMDFVLKHINKEVIITGSPYNTQKWQYPLEALREIITNMVIHRDYRSSSDSIVKIFDDKIEFYNPGRLPEDITIENLLKNNYRSTPRNKLIADCCKDMGVIEKYGSGIRRIIGYFEEENQILPEFRNISEGFMVTVFAQKENVRKDVVENVIENVVENVVENKYEQILNYIGTNNHITAEQIAKIMKVTERTVQRYLEKLKEKGFIERIGPDKGGYWKVLKF